CETSTKTRRVGDMRPPRSRTRCLCALELNHRSLGHLHFLAICQRFGSPRHGHPKTQLSVIATKLAVVDRCLAARPVALGAGAARSENELVGGHRTSLRR